MQAATRQRFLADYVKIRHAEGRGSDDAAYYLALPYRDLSGRLQYQWDIRGKSFRAFAGKVFPALERQLARPLQVADLGAGNCWLSYRLALRGHKAMAVDILDDRLDGLRAGQHFQHATPFPRIAAEFDALPFATGSLDAAIFNASIHYSTDYRRTLLEVKRCLQPDGLFFIVDSPIYEKRAQGEAMVRERRALFEAQYGYPSDALGSIEFFDEEMLEELRRELKIVWQIHRPWYGWQWAMRPWIARWKRKRPPSRFWILTGRFL